MHDFTPNPPLLLASLLASSAQADTLLSLDTAERLAQTAALQYLPELLLLGGGGPENDDACARAAASTLTPKP